MDWVKEFSELSSWKEKGTYSWLPRVQLSDLYPSLFSRETTSSLSSAYLLGVVVTSRSTSIGEEFSAGSFMILEVEVLVDELENFFSKHLL